MRNIRQRDEANSVNLGASSSVVLFSERIPIKEKMVVRGFANYGDPTAFGQVTWEIRKNGLGVYPYNAIKDQIGYSAQVQKTQDIYFNGGDVLEVVATNASGVSAYNIGARILFEYYEE